MGACALALEGISSIIHLSYCRIFFFFLYSICLFSLRLYGGLERLTEPSLGAVDPQKINYIQIVSDPDSLCKKERN